MTDANGTVHQYTRDLLGRPTLDAVITLPDTVDNAVLAIGLSYEVRSLVQKITSYASASGTGTVVNEVENERGQGQTLKLNSQAEAGRRGFRTVKARKIGQITKLRTLATASDQGDERNGTAQLSHVSTCRCQSEPRHFAPSGAWCLVLGTVQLESFHFHADFPMAIDHAVSRAAIFRSRDDRRLRKEMNRYFGRPSHETGR